MISGAKIMEEVILFFLIAVIVVTAGWRGMGEAERLDAGRLSLEKLRASVQAASNDESGMTASPQGPDSTWDAPIVKVGTNQEANQPASTRVDMKVMPLSKQSSLPSTSFFNSNQPEAMPPQLISANTPIAGAPMRPRINLNTATMAQLMELSGIGESRSRAIMEYRDSIGGFSSLEQLTAVSGIGPKTLANIRADLTLGPEMSSVVQGFGSSSSLGGAMVGTVQTPDASAFTAQGKININTAGVELLGMLSGIGEKRAHDIIENRRQRGAFRRPEDITRVKGIGEKTFQKNAHLISVRD